MRRFVNLINNFAYLFINLLIMQFSSRINAFLFIPNPKITWDFASDFAFFIINRLDEEIFEKLWFKNHIDPSKSWLQVIVLFLQNLNTIEDTNKVESCENGPKLTKNLRNSKAGNEHYILLQNIFVNSTEV